MPLVVRTFAQTCVCVLCIYTATTTNKQTLRKANNQQATVPALPYTTRNKHILNESLPRLGVNNATGYVCQSLRPCRFLKPTPSLSLSRS